ncbi:hypothetical protein H6F98_09295 [Microcoleus sp. FACHB-SPT15]|uniref:hypothetical protein n=1 Tax=Microcoleus sp. FACHB-SPT15 TaxID=2692830 RepID=UPI00199C5578|nr:hypothetical protein [Microcoleus sp. FACHB-SPT15]MBD1805642.1 hypothetical protein [Microcoleus sp. FACHB-SPT15]
MQLPSDFDGWKVPPLAEQMQFPPDPKPPSDEDSLLRSHWCLRAGTTGVDPAERVMT